jgi:hypothetical protein
MMLMEGKTHQKSKIGRTLIMSTQERARALMMHHYQMVKNRQQSMLGRIGEEIGLSTEVSHYWNPIQGKIEHGARITYDRSNATMS